MQICTMHALGFVTLLSLVHVCLGQIRACYYPNGQQTTNDVPCDPDASNSTCCGPGYICSTNIYCLTQGNEQVVGSCTDQTWQSDDCPLPLSGGFNWNQLTNCSDGTFCPNSNNTNCCAAHQGIEMLSYSNTAIIPTPTNDLGAYYANAGLSILSSASSSLSMTMTSATSASAVPTSTRPAITTTALPASSTGRTTTSTSQASSSSSGGVSKGASAGAGVGAAFGVLIIGAAVIFFIYRRKRKNGVVGRTSPGMMMARG